MVYVICQWRARERAFRLPAAAREFPGSNRGRLYPHPVPITAFAADNSAAAPTLGVADTVRGG